MLTPPTEGSGIAPMAPEPNAATRDSANVVIASNWWGKAKTIVQVAAIFFLIAVEPSPMWVDGLVYGMVAITIVSGVDYFFGLRRVLREAEARREAGVPAAGGAETTGP